MAEQKKYVDSELLIAECDRAIQKLEAEKKNLSYSDYVGRLVSIRKVREMIVEAPADEVVPTSCVRDLLDTMNSMNAAGRMKYDVYSELFDIVAGLLP